MPSSRRDSSSSKFTSPAAQLFPQQPPAPGLKQPLHVRDTDHKVVPVRPTGDEEKVVARHKTKTVIEYEFYIPAAIWEHRAVVAFISHLEKHTKGATILKTALGVWEGQPEDTNIYRMILELGEATQVNIREQLQDAIGDMLAGLAEWIESYQEAFMFTEKEIIFTLSSLTNVSKDFMKDYLKRKNFKRKLRHQPEQQGMMLEIHKNSALWQAKDAPHA